MLGGMMIEPMPTAATAATPTAAIPAFTTSTCSPVDDVSLDPACSGEAEVEFSGSVVSGVVVGMPISDEC